VPLLGEGSWVHSVAGAGAYLYAKFYFDSSNHLATIHQRHRQTDGTGQTGRQRSDSIGQTVLQAVAQKPVRVSRSTHFHQTSLIYLCGQLLLAHYEPTAQ